MATILETPRLVVRELEDDDLDFLTVLLGDPEVMRYFPHPCDRAESEAWLRRQQDRYETHGLGYWAAVDKTTGEPIGQVGLLPPKLDGDDAPDLGYMIHRPFWRRGYAAEGAAACRDHAFAARGDRRVYGLVRPENGPSLAVARKLGLSLDPARRVELAGFEHLVFFADAPRGEFKET